MVHKIVPVHLNELRALTKLFFERMPLLGLTSCGNPRVDGSTHESFHGTCPFNPVAYATETEPFIQSRHKALCFIINKPSEAHPHATQDRWFAIERSMPHALFRGIFNILPLFMSKSPSYGPFTTKITNV